MNTRTICHNPVFAPELLFKDKEVCVTGRVELYKGKVQIVLRRKKDMRIKE